MMTVVDAVAMATEILAVENPDAKIVNVEISSHLPGWEKDDPEIIRITYLEDPATNRKKFLSVRVDILDDPSLDTTRCATCSQTAHPTREDI